MGISMGIGAKVPDKRKEKAVLLLFYLGLLMELLILLIDKSALANPPEGQLFRLTFLLFALKICFTRYTVREWLWLILFGILGWIVYRSTENNVILRAVVFVAALKGIELKAVVKYSFFITLSGCVLIVFLACAGILGDISRYEEYREGINETRYCLGMGHPNALHCMFLMVLLLFMWWYHEKMKPLIPVLLMAGNLGMFLLTGSKTGFGAAAVAIIIAFIAAKRPGVLIRKWPYVLGAVIFTGCIALSVWAAKYSSITWYENIASKVDTLLTGRMTSLYFGTNAHAGALVTWKLFSAPDHLLYYFDMGWVRMFYWFGIVPGLIFTLLHLLLIRVCYRKKDYAGLMIIVSLAVYTIVEAHIISVYIARNYLLLLFGAYAGELLCASAGREEYWWQTGRRLLSGPWHHQSKSAEADMGCKNESKK